MKTLCERYTKIIIGHDLHADGSRVIGKMKNNRFFVQERRRSFILEMLQRLPDIADSGKQNRWLGIVIGWMWAMDIRTIQKFRDDVLELLERQKAVSTLTDQAFKVTPLEHIGLSLTPTEEDSAEIMEQIRQSQYEADQTRSRLANQVVGAENESA